jgi:hypothetical protein
MFHSFKALVFSKKLGKIFSRKVCVLIKNSLEVRYSFLNLAGRNINFKAITRR